MLLVAAIQTDKILQYIKLANDITLNNHSIFKTIFWHRKLILK